MLTMGVVRFLFRCDGIAFCKGGMWLVVAVDVVSTYVSTGVFGTRCGFGVGRMRYCMTF